MNHSKQSVKKEPDTKAATEPPKPSLSTGTRLRLTAVGALAVLIVSVFLLNATMQEQDVIPKSDMSKTIKEMPFFKLLLGDYQAPPPNTDPRVDWVKVKAPDGGYTGIEKMCDNTTLIYRDDSAPRGETSISTENDSPECRPALQNR